MVLTPSGDIGLSETSSNAPLGMWLTNPTMKIVAVSMSIAEARRGQRVQVAIRQENIRLGPGGAGSDRANRFAATVVFHAFAGPAHHYVVQLADGRELEVTSPSAALPLARGARAVIEWGPEDVVLLTGSESTAGGSA